MTSLSGGSRDGMSSSGMSSPGMSRVGKRNVELRTSLCNIVSAQPEELLHQGLETLDAAIYHATVHLSELRQKSRSLLLGSSLRSMLTSDTSHMHVVETNRKLAASSRMKLDALSVSRCGVNKYLLPRTALHGGLRQEICTLIQQQNLALGNFWADQSHEYKQSEYHWKELLRQWEHIKETEACRTAARIHEPRQSRASLLCLDSSRSTEQPKVPVATKETSTRARKALRHETAQREHIMSDVLACSAEEARFERGAVKDEDLPVPLPISILIQEERHLNQLGLCHHTPEPWDVESRFALWSDFEKCIFLDKFLQYPKNFGRIAAFLVYKNARDCARLYYDSKYEIDYKALLREHQQRRRGVRICWEITSSAVQTFGGNLEYNRQQNVVWFRLPPESALSAGRITLHAKGEKAPREKSLKHERQSNPKIPIITTPSTCWISPGLGCTTPNTPQANRQANREHKNRLGLIDLKTNNIKQHVDKLPDWWPCPLRS